MFAFLRAERIVNVSRLEEMREICMAKREFLILEQESEDGLMPGLTESAEIDVMARSNVMRRFFMNTFVILIRELNN